MDTGISEISREVLCVYTVWYLSITSSLLLLSSQFKLAQIDSFVAMLAPETPMQSQMAQIDQLIGCYENNCTNPIDTSPLSSSPYRQVCGYLDHVCVYNNI